MRVALVHGWIGGRAGGGGGSRHMLDVAQRLFDLGHRVSVVSYDCDPGEDLTSTIRDLDVRSVRHGPFDSRNGKRVALRRFWREMPKVARLVPADVDIIHAHEWPALHAARLAAGRSGVPFVWSRNDHTIWERAVVPGVRDDVQPGPVVRLVRAAGSVGDLLDARRAGAILCLDEDSRRMAERAYRRPAEVIHAPPADAFFSPPPRSEARAQFAVLPSTFLVLGVGVMNPHRRFEDLVDAIGVVRNRRVRALIIGSDHVDPAYGRFVRERVQHAGLADRIELVFESVSEARLRAAYAAADAFVFPNDHRQSWGLAPLEALASGTPVVVTRAAGVAAAIAGQAGVTVVDPRAPAQIATALEQRARAHTPPDLAATQAWIADELGGRRYIERVLAVYRRLIAARS